MRLKVTVDGERMFDCTNEAVVHTAQVAKIRHFEIRLDAELVERVRADGIIIATPTGSTSYSMSAGGPIVDPHVEAIIATAIAPFKPASRPHVFPPTGQVHVQLVKPKECVLVMDGQHESSLKGTEDVVLTASERHAKLIRFRDDFYRRIEDTLSRQGGRPHEAGLRDCPQDAPVGPRGGALPVHPLVRRVPSGGGGHEYVEYSRR